MSDEKPDLPLLLFDSENYNHDFGLLERAGTEILDLRAKLLLANERLFEAVDALRPFAALAENAGDPKYDPAFVMTPFTFEDCEHARSIVEKHK